MIKIGILSISDTRAQVHESLSPYIQECEDKIRALLENEKVEVVCGEQIVNNAGTAAEQGRRMQAAGVHGVILNIAIFSFPNLTLGAVNAAGLPSMAVSLANPKLPGLVGLLANVGFLHQNGIECPRVWGGVDDPLVKKDIMIFARAAYTVSSLKGQVLGILGGRSIGMGTGAVNPNQVMRIFGVDVEHADQMEILRCAEQVGDSAVDRTDNWLRENMGDICFDGDKLTPQSLREQIKYYHAIKNIVRDCKMDFIGVKCHIEMSAHHGPPCLACTMMNDPYDDGGAKDPTAFSCEADCDGALSMQIMKLVSGEPSFLVDVRYCDSERGMFTFCNCGSVASWYAGRSDNPSDNLKKVRLVPIIPKYTGKGCHVQFVAAAGEMTFCRLTHTEDQYEMLVFRGNCVDMTADKLEDTCPQWPHMFVEVGGSTRDILDHMNSNHVHGATGNRVEELRSVCRMLGIACHVVV